MAHKPRFGSLQFWPRKRAQKLLPSINWKNIESRVSSKSKILGFIGYKVGMLSAIVKNSTPDSMTKGKQIVIPVTILECPTMHVFSIRFYKNKQVLSDVLAPNLEKEKELKRKIFLPKKAHSLENFETKLGNYDDITLLVSSNVKSTGIKKTPDLSEIGLQGTMQEKFALVKKLLGAEIKIEDVFEKGQLIDIKAVTKGKGFQGPVKRFGISLKQHKTEKGVRRPGTLGPWVPKKVSFKVPMAGQMGLFTRLVYNLKIIDLNKIANKNINPSSGFKHYGNIKTSYILLKGSVAGTAKRAIMLTYASRPKKERAKENFELIKLE